MQTSVILARTTTEITRDRDGQIEDIWPLSQGTGIGLWFILISHCYYYVISHNNHWHLSFVFIDRLVSEVVVVAA